MKVHEFVRKLYVEQGPQPSEQEITEMTYNPFEFVKTLDQIKKPLDTEKSDVS